MTLPRLTVRQTIGWCGILLVLLIVAAVAFWRGDIVKAGLDPKIPFQTYDPPPAPDYATPSAWAMRARATAMLGKLQLISGPRPNCTLSPRSRPSPPTVATEPPRRTVG